MLMKSLRYNLKMLLMFFFILGVDQNVINKYHNILIQLWHKHEIHHVHKMCRSIGESKRYNQILIQPIPSGECSFRNVLWTNLHLMITKTEINLGEDFSIGKLIKQNVDVVP
jgi:hypothetical protein